MHVIQQIANDQSLWLEDAALTTVVAVYRNPGAPGPQQPPQPAAVRTAKDAEHVALRYVTVGPDRLGLDARDLFQTGEPFRLANDVPDFSTKNDQIWEVRVVRAGGAVVRVLWVSGGTSAVRQVFPFQGSK
jgi:hypothetical protein